MRVIRIVLIAAMAAGVPASSAFAQSTISPRSTISFLGGTSSADSTTGVLLGGSYLFDLNDRASIEAQGAYFDRGSGADAFSAGGTLLVNLISRRDRIVPYAAVGAGLYRATFDLAHPAMLGPIGAQLGPGSVVCPGPGSGFRHGPGSGFGLGTCPATAAGQWGVGRMPEFYARRLGPLAVPAGGVWDNRSFTDPALSLGGGIRFIVHERWMLRPDARALVVFADGDVHTIGVFGVQLGYRF